MSASKWWIIGAGLFLGGCGPIAVAGPPGETDAGNTTGDVVVIDSPPPTSDQPQPPTDGPQTCTSSSQCGPTMECRGGEGCAIPWTCQRGLGRPCTDDVAPFCGCDGVTFAGSSSCPPRPFAHRGPCEGPPPLDGGPGPDGCVLPNDAICPRGQTCRIDSCNSCFCSLTGQLACTGSACLDGGPPPTRRCRSTADCGPGELCAGEPGCGTTWTCRSLSGTGCTADVSPFCSCDGLTFAGSSTCPGRPYAHRGPCEGPPPVDAGPVDAGPAGCRLPTGGICPFGEVCALSECTACFCSPDGQLRCTGACVDAGTPPTPCRSNRDCRPSEQCTGAPGCGTPWTCRPSSEVGPCTDNLAPFCGCDGRAFLGSSTCPGQPYAHTGSCGIVPPDAGNDTCVIMGVRCQQNVPCQINACTTCTCTGDAISCAGRPGCEPDGGTDDPCRRQDARGSGRCALFFGYAWNGRECSGISGCTCLGTDCGDLYSSLNECRRAHAECPVPF